MQTSPAMFVRTPRPELAPFIERLWTTAASPPNEAVRVERMLPSGAMHLVLRFSAAPLRLFRSESDRAGDAVGHALVGGLRMAPYFRDVSSPAAAVGAMLRPGASWALFGVPAAELAHRHTDLDDLWGRDAAFVREQVESAPSGSARLDAFEGVLAARIRRLRGLHPAVAHALGRFAADAAVRSVVEETGYSHRRFVTLFADDVGLTPKAYCRVQRFQKVLADLTGYPGRDLARIAADAGHADQSHMTRDFRELAGISPGEFRRIAPEQAHHVPVPRAR
jgi:AraC-like DNA-binding protein